jgi:hypothetical protein
MTSKHKPTYKVDCYPGSTLAYKITIACSCGTQRTLTDGAITPTMKLARAAHKAHVAKATATA